MLLYRKQTFMCDPSFRESIEDDERSGGPSTSKTDESVDKTFFMDYNSIVHHEFLPKGQTINKQYYLEAMRHCVNQFAKKDRICGNHVTRGRTERIPSNGHRIRLIWLPVTSSCSVDSKNCSGEPVFAAKRR